jgi:hypothetical protein
VASFVETLKVCSAGTITVVDMAWYNPGGRGWCLYEWNHTCALHGIEALRFVGMSDDERQQLIDEIDVENAKCAKVDDQTMILGEILQNHGSFEAFNQKLKLCLQLPVLLKARGTACPLLHADNGRRVHTKGLSGRLRCHAMPSTPLNRKLTLLSRLIIALRTDADAMRMHGAIVSRATLVVPCLPSSSRVPLSTVEYP